MSNEFDRIKRLPPYVFEEVNRLKADLRGKGKDIIDFGMGNPDMPTPKHIREKLKETVEPSTIVSTKILEIGSEGLLGTIGD